MLDALIAGYIDTKLVIKIEQIEIIRIEFGFNSVGILLKK